MTTDNLGELAERIRHLARVPNLVVACDYDGVLSPLVDNPLEARPDRDSTTALKTLADQANTSVVVISGRSLRDLATLTRFPEEIMLIGSHGAEFDLDYESQLDFEVVKMRYDLVDEVREIGRRYDAIVEEKPVGVTFHFRGMEADKSEAARDELFRGPAGREGVYVRNGHDVIEFIVVDADKGTALNKVRHQVGASAAIFFGDDLTDEDAFRTLGGSDIAVKVGNGPTAAGYRVPDPATVAQVLALLAEFRDRWLKGEGLIPVQDHSLLSDLRTAAIVDPRANVTWMCVPRIDSGAVFASLLGDSSAGHFSIEAAEPGVNPTGQRYLNDTMVLETSYPEFTVTDFLDSSSGRTRRKAGRSDLIRILEGTGRAAITFAPRLDFGRVPTQLELRPEGVVVLGTADLMVLRAPDVDWEIVKDGSHQTARGHVNLTADQPVTLELRAGTGTLRNDTRSVGDRMVDTAHYWTNWISKLDIPLIQSDTVSRSALLLKSLCHGPTGAIVAAATTSLPQHPGGVRNWDYRYCWLRDGAMTAAALARLGSRAEAMAFLDWILRILETRTDPERLAPLYNVTGRHLAPEAEIADLPGYAGSRPVRVGNAADGQVQLDLFGPVVELVSVLLQQGEALSAEHWRLVEAMVLAVSRRWHEPDHGIWEVRLPPRHYVYSKVMCWLTVDRAIAIADEFLDREPAAWVDLRDQIAEDVLTKGWRDDLGTFTAAYDGDDLDATVLAVGLSGLLTPDDERFVSTVAAIERDLRVGVCVYRYTADDGLPGREGGFNLMSSWMIDALCLTGRVEEASALFDQLCALVGQTGIMAEQYDPDNEKPLGNIPRTYSHVGLINNALNLDACS